MKKTITTLLVLMCAIMAQAQVKIATKLEKGMKTVYTCHLITKVAGMEIVVGILSQYHDLDIRIWAQIKSIEDETPGWEAGIRAILGVNKLCERFKIRFVELLLQYLLPTGFYLDLHNKYIKGSYKN